MEDVTLEAAEAWSSAWNDAFIRREGWRDHNLSDPVDAIAIFADAMRGKAMLDAGCGWARYAHRFLDAGLEYTGIDHSSEAVNLARLSYPGLRFELGSISRMPFPSTCFDGIWSCCALSSTPKSSLGVVLAEHRRVLKHDGCMMIVIPFPIFGDSDEIVYLQNEMAPPIYQAHYDLDEFREYLIRAGFHIVGTDYDLARGSQYALVRHSGP